MARKKSNALIGEFTFFDVVYEDGAKRSNRKVPTASLGGFDADEDVARAAIEAQDRDIAEKSGRPMGPIKSISRSTGR